MAVAGSLLLAACAQNGPTPAPQASTATLAVAAANPAYYQLHADGDKPDRHVYYVKPLPTRSPPVDLSLQAYSQGRDKAWQKLQDAFKSAEVIEVREAAKGPATLVYDADLRCDTRQIKLESVSLFGRDERMQADSPRDWAPAAGGWQTRLLEFSCGRGIEHDAEFALIGNYQRAQLDDITWKRFWPDSRPGPVAQPRPADTPRSDPILASKPARAAPGTASAGAAKDDTGRANGDSSRKASAEAARRKLPALDSWINASEGELIQAWGPPNDQSAKEGNRMVTYVRGYVTKRAITQATGGATGVVAFASQSHRCLIEFGIRAGKVHSYSIAPRNASCAEAVIPRGPGATASR